MTVTILTRYLAAVFAAFSLAMLAIAPMAHADAVGKVTAVQTQVNKSGAGAVSVGTTVSMGDQLQSNETGLGMLVFRDESSAKLGPNSSLTIDEFVYSPGSSGSLGISLDRGISRFYGGQVSKKGAMVITTPHVILGVRGGIIDANVDGGKTSGILRAGKLTCSLNGKTRVITKPGFACVSDGNSIDVVKFRGLLSALDRPAQLAGGAGSAERGPSIEVNAGCAGPGSSSNPACQSRNGQLPSPLGNGGSALNSGGVVRTGSGSGQQDFCTSGCKIIAID